MRRRLFTEALGISIAIFSLCFRSREKMLGEEVNKKIAAMTNIIIFSRLTGRVKTQENDARRRNCVFGGDHHPFVHVLFCSM
jgi:hypothetical protein